MSFYKEEWKGSPESVEYKPGKGIFIGLLAFCTLVILTGGFFFWFIPTVGLGNIHPALPYVLGSLFLGIGAFIVGGVVVITVSILRGKEVFLSSRFRGLLIKFFLPLMVLVGGLLRVPRIKIEQAFIEINNQMVRSMRKHFRPDRLLVLMPHCIQFDDCRIKVTKDVTNCVGCGKCEIGDLVELMDRYKIKLFVSTGGTIARMKVYEHRPDVVIAVACERDLASGVQDAYPLPVMAIVNKRPNGYCLETGVAVEEVARAIIDLVGENEVAA